MPLYIQGMSSCAVQEICNLSTHLSAEDAMKRFCAQVIGDRPDCPPDRQPQEQAQGDNKGWYTEGLGENYIFHGVEQGGHTEQSSYADKQGYASRFAAFITENKLGDVFSGKEVPNHRYHSKHLSKVFVWNPDRAAVFKWWAAHKPAAAKPVVLQEYVIKAVF